ncbi:MAG: hypothetical protein LBT14_09210 [Treponema sp.]|jgi:hypothetical protein|nr:hypothetical protein [Treponema sp.]
MIHRAIHTPTFFSIGYNANTSGNKMAFPVSPANYIYSHFEHVSGVPAPEGVRGVAISKLKILDVLIEQLSKIKKQGEPVMGLGGPLSDDRIDALIEQYEHQIRQSKAVAIPYMTVPEAPTGAVFNLVA